MRMLVRLVGHFSVYRKVIHHMPTQEERIAAVEFDLKQFRTETLRAYTDMAYEVTILKGLGEDSIKRLSALAREVKANEENEAHRFGLIDDRLNQMYDEINANSLLLHQILDKLDERK